MSDNDFDLINEKNYKDWLIQEERLKNSPCRKCEYYPAGSIFHDKCPQSIPLIFNWDVPIDVWEEITLRIGCKCASFDKIK
jgi:hypothetical protein